jgi:hypothetical protein
VAAALTGVDAPVVLRAEVRAAVVPPTVAAAQTGTDAPVAGLTEIMTFTDGAAIPLWTGTMVIMGSRPLSGTSVPTAGGLPSPRPTTSSGRSDEGTAPGASYVGSSSVRRHRLL